MSIHIQWTLVLTNSSIYRTNLSVSSFLNIKTFIQNLGLTNTAFNEFLIISNKNIGFLLRFYHVFSDNGFIIFFKLRNFFAAFESLKPVEFPMPAVVRNMNLKHFHSNVSSFQITL